MSGLAELAPIFLDGRWRRANDAGSFQAFDPQTGTELPDQFPISNWQDCELALDAAWKASAEMAALDASVMAEFLEKYADDLAKNAEAVARLAALETGLPYSPRLKDVELLRTVDQLRQAAGAAREGSWRLATIDTKNNIRSCYAAIGPVVAIGPNNFPLAFNGASGGDFAAAIAAGNPVIVKGHPSHPGTTRKLIELADAAIQSTRMPRAAVQLIYRLSHGDGAKLVSDRRIGATGFTGGRHSGLALKSAADAAGKPIFLEMSSINPVVILPEAIRQRGAEIVEEFCMSCLLGAGQFCTNPGIVVLLSGPEADGFIEAVSKKFSSSPAGTMLSRLGRDALAASVRIVADGGAILLVGGQHEPGPRFAFQNTLFRVSGDTYLKRAALFQTEMFGAASLCVVAHSTDQLAAILESLEGNLTGTIYAAQSGIDQSIYEWASRIMRRKVGRLLNDKMPTGVAVSSAMNHGGPFPATGHPHFTAVGIPASIRRFTMLQCYDNIADNRLPPILRDKNPNGLAWRLIDGSWSQTDVKR